VVQGVEDAEAGDRVARHAGGADGAEVVAAVGPRPRRQHQARALGPGRELQELAGRAVAALVARRPQLLDEPVLEQQGGELRSARLVVDRLQLVQRPSDEAPVAAAGAEVGAHPPAQVGGLADVEGASGAVAHEVHAGRGGQVLGQRQLVRVARPADARERDGALQRVDAALGEHPDEPHEQLGGGLRVGQGPVDGADGGVGPLRERGQVVAARPPVEQPPGQHQGVEPRLGEVPPRQPATLVVEEPEVEGGVVGHQHVLAGEGGEAVERLGDVGPPLDHPVVDPGELGDDGGDRPAGVDEGLEAVDHLEAAHPDGADLGDLRMPRRPAGGLEVDDAERRVGQVGVRPVRRRQAHQVASEPREARVALHDLGHELALEALGAPPQAKELRRDVAHLQGAAAPREQRAEAVGHRVAPLGPRLGGGQRQPELGGDGDGHR